MPTKTTKKTAKTKTNKPALSGSASRSLDLSGIAEAIRHIGDTLIGKIDFDGLTSDVKNLRYLRNISEAMAAQVIAQHGSDDDRKKVVERLKDRFFSKDF